MFYKILFWILTAIVCLLTLYISRALNVSKHLINSWRECSEKDDFTNILKWSTNYKKNPIIDVKNENCRVRVYEIYNVGTETTNGETKDVYSTGYQFIITNPGEGYKYSKTKTDEADAEICFYYPGKIQNDAGEEIDGEAKVTAQYYSYELHNIYAVSQAVFITDSSVNKGVNEEFKEANKADVTGNYTKVEIKDLDGNVMITLDNLSSSIDISDLSTWETGFTNDEKEKFMKPSNYASIILPILIELAIAGLIFFLIFFRKKKERLFLSDSVNQKATVQAPKKETKQIEYPDDIVDEDKIEADDVDENSLL